ncbi:hypothetical protein SeMB42_g04263 [Synchytrium endobioticum]|uniref:Arginase n=1 Tax=Synchytrium endobioticum TaxID=286115 RepID=A0A507CZQ9_9FUNG|nr:hypothetical protein SeMB42_g04263 [Synchytrium endobioticum]
MPRKKRKNASKDGEDVQSLPTADGATNGDAVNASDAGEVAPQSPLQKRPTLFIDQPIKIIPTPHDRFLKLPRTVGIVGAGFNGGQPRGGVENAPSQLVDAGLVEQLKDLGWQVQVDEKFPTYESLKPTVDEDVEGKLRNVKYVSNVTKSIAETVGAHAREGRLALTIGGDHSLAMGTVAGTASVYPDVGVIWVDAHADINTPETTLSGNLHGMPVAFLMGLGSCGLRDIDRDEKRILKHHKIRVFTMHEVDRYGIGKVVDMALQHLGTDCPIHLSFDVDALDPSVAPATGTPVRGGLTFREGHYICEAIYETGRVVAVDIMEVNPLLGQGDALRQTIEIGCSLTRASLGETLL